MKYVWVPPETFTVAMVVVRFEREYVVGAVGEGRFEFPVFVLAEASGLFDVTYSA
jgi:hypothetical protein